MPSANEISPAGHDSETNVDELSNNLFRAAIGNALSPIPSHLEPGMTTRVSVIDCDAQRRGNVRRELNSRNVHAQVYEGAAELFEARVETDLIFVCDEPQGSLPATVADIRTTPRPVVPIIGYAADPSAEMVVAGIRAGASDYLRWPFVGQLLDALLTRVANGEDRLLKQELLRVRARAKVDKLSLREAQVLPLLVRGLTRKGIGSALGISARTVDIHCHNILVKLGAQSSVDAARIAVHAGVDDSDEILHPKE